MRISRRDSGFESHSADGTHGGSGGRRTSPTVAHVNAGGKDEFMVGGLLSRALMEGIICMSALDDE